MRHPKQIYLRFHFLFNNSFGNEILGKKIIIFSFARFKLKKNLWPSLREKKWRSIIHRPEEFRREWILSLGGFKARFYYENMSLWDMTPCPLIVTFVLEEPVALTIKVWAKQHSLPELSHDVFVIEINYIFFTTLI